MSMTYLHKCGKCGLYLRCFYDEIKKKFLCNRCFNQKNAVMAADDCVHIAIEKDAMREVYNQFGQRGVQKMVDDLIDSLAPGEEKISTYKEDNPMITRDRGDHFLITQKVDR